MRTLLILCAWLVAATDVVVQPIDIGTPPGRLVDIGGRQLHFHCAGSGSPTVILEAGASSFAIDWSLVQPEIAKTNRVCSYDRAGFGWSMPRNEVSEEREESVFRCRINEHQPNNLVRMVQSLYELRIASQCEATAETMTSW